MALGLVILFGVSVLVFLGLAHRVLDRMHLNDRQALLMLGLMLIGGFVDVPIYRGVQSVRLNIGGAVVPTLLAVYVLVRADTPRETQRGIVAAAVVGVGLLAVTKLFAFEEGTTLLDPLYVFGLLAGVVGYLVGRSRRASFAGAVLGVVFLDIAHLVEVTVRRIPATVDIGGAGVFDAVVVAAVVAVGLAEVFGEAIERVRGGPSPNAGRRVRVDSPVAPDTQAERGREGGVRDEVREDMGGKHDGSRSR